MRIRDWSSDVCSSDLFAAVETGEAMAALPREVADRRPALVRIETPLPEPVQSVQMGVHSDMRETPRIRAFMDFAVAELKARDAELNPKACGRQPQYWKIVRRERPAPPDWTRPR